MMGAAPLLDYIASANARDAALTSVLENSGSWGEKALAELRMIANNPSSYGWVNTEAGVTGENIRTIIRNQIGDPPNSPNAYGAFIMRAIKAGVLERTGVSSQMKATTSHRRATPTYFLVRTQ